MNLLELVDYLVDPDKLAKLYHELGLFSELVDEYGVTIYMVGSTIELDADIRLLSFRETKGRTQMELDGLAYVYVLEVDLAQYLLSDAEGGVVTRLEQANRLLHYALYDA